MMDDDWTMAEETDDAYECRKDIEDVKDLLRRRNSVPYLNPTYKIRTAKKTYVCCKCGRRNINPGQKYYEESGYGYRNRTCLECAGASDVKKDTITLTKSELVECMSAVQVVVSTSANIGAWSAHDKYEGTYNMLKRKLKELK